MEENLDYVCSRGKQFTESQTNDFVCKSEAQIISCIGELEAVPAVITKLDGRCFHKHNREEKRLWKL